MENNAILISNTALTPDVVGQSTYDSMTYKNEITYEAETSELLRQVRDGERGETNAKIKKMLTQYSYYTYNGQRDRAIAIEEDKENVKKNHGEYKHEDAQGKLIDGTKNDPRDQNLVAKFSINADSLSAFKILENMNTLDADEIYRDFKELIVELNYFDKEYFAGSEVDVFQWPIPDCGTAGWPVREIEKPINTYGTLINSRINLLNLKNLFLQYKQDDDGTTSGNSEPTNPMDNQPAATTTTTQSDPEGAITDDAGNPLVDRSGSSTDAWRRQVEEEERRRQDRRASENYTPGESGQRTQNNEGGTQGESDSRHAGGAVDYSKITEDFTKAEDESGAPGWYDAFDIVMDNMDVSDANCPYRLGSERSYMSFLNGLGGVFAEYAGDENNGEGTYEDFVAGCQYVYGLCTMFGFEYCNGRYEKCDVYQHGFYGGPKVATTQASINDAYHGTPRHSGSNHHDWWGNGSSCSGCCNRLMDDTMIDGRFCTNCNYTTDKVYYKAGLFDSSDGSCAWGDLIRKYGGNYVYRIEELQVGDLIQHFDGGVWKHVSFVGEVNDDEIVVYETGHGWISTGDFRFVYNRYTDSKPSTHDSWFGVHLFDLQPRNRDEYEGYDGNVDVVSPITGEVIDAGEVQITNIQTNEIETVGYIKIRALMAEDIGSCIPDANIKNMEDPEIKVAKLKNGNSEEKKEYYYGGYKLFLQEYQNAKVNGFILYMEGFDLRLFEKDASGKIKFKSRRSSRINYDQRWKTS